MSQPVLIFQKLTLTLDQMRAHARRIPGRTTEAARNLKEYEQQQETTRDMLVTELTALAVTIEDMRKDTDKETEKNNQSVQAYGEAIRSDGRGLASNLDEIQDELIALGANLRQNINSQSQEMQSFNEIDVQSDQKRFENLDNYCIALDVSSNLTGHTGVSLEIGKRSLVVELNTEEALDQRADDRLAQGHNLLAARFIAEGCPAAAVEELKQAVHRAPKTAEFWFNLALAFVEVNEPEAAAEAYDHAVSLAPSSPQVNQVGGWVLMNQGYYEGAVDNFQQALQVSCALLDELSLMEGLAEAEYQVGRPDKAKAAWERVLEIDPYHPTARLSLEWIR